MKSPPSPSEDTPISAETLLAVRRYNQEVASYTLRQWNVAKLESEKKERDRRRRRAEVLAQRQHIGAGGAGTGTGHSSSNGTGPAYGNQVGSATTATNTRQSGLAMSAPGTRPSDAHRTKSDGPLMMVSRRRSDRDRGGGMSGSTSSGPAHAQSGHRPLHDHQRLDYAKRAHSIHNDIAHLHQVTQMQAQQTQDVSAVQSTSVKRIEKLQCSSAQAADPDSDFAKPVTNHIESATVEMTLAFDDANPYIPVEEEDEPLPPPDPVWHHRRSDSTPPIPIPRPPPSVVSHRSDIGSSGSSALSAKSASPARALGFAAHLGMTSISGAPSAALTGSVSASASTSNPVSEGSSRMSSFSEHNEGFRHGVSKKLTGEGAALAAAAANAALRPRRHHRSSLASVEPMVAERLDVSGPHIVEGAIGHLRRMTVSGGERAIFELDQQ